MSCLQTLPGAIHNGNMKMMESRGQRSSDRVVGEDIDSRNDETFGEAALGKLLLTLTPGRHTRLTIYN